MRQVSFRFGQTLRLNPSQQRVIIKGLMNHPVAMYGTLEEQKEFVSNDLLGNQLPWLRANREWRGHPSTVYSGLVGDIRDRLWKSDADVKEFVGKLQASYQGYAQKKTQEIQFLQRWLGVYEKQFEELQTLTQEWEV
jgi:hypothetical protein